MASGHCGIVLGANVLSDTPPLPPLVFKFGRKNCNAYMFREAFFYDELESLQGTVLPRYFGYFQAILPIDWEVEPWVQDPLLDLDEPEEEDGEEYYNGRGYYSDEVQRTFLKEFSRSDIQVVSAIVMERLGGTYLPIGGHDGYPPGKPLPDEMLHMVQDAFRRLTELGVTHGDVRHSNILKVLDTCDSNNVSDNNEPSFPFRLIDLELASKTNGNDFYYNLVVFNEIKILVEHLPMGTIINQNSF